MRVILRSLFLFTCLHFFLFFLSGMVYGYMRIRDARQRIFEPAGESALFDYIYRLLMQPIGRFFWDEQAGIAVLPLWGMALNSLIWGAVLTILLFAVNAAIGRPAVMEDVKDNPRNVFLVGEAIYLTFVFSMLWLAVVLFEIAYQIDRSSGVWTDYVLKLGRFPAVPLFFDESALEPEFLLQDLPVAIANGAIWGVAVAVLLRALRTVRGGAQSK